MAKRVAVVLSGCGYLDGSEIYESSFALLALDLAGIDVQCFAPDREQLHVVHHTTQTPVEGEARNILTEASRLARGKIKPLDEAPREIFDAIVFPGGFGVAKNLCDYALKGPACTVDHMIHGLIGLYRGTRRPICAICIAPVLVAKCLGPTHQPVLTIGSDPTTAEHIEQMGGKHVVAAATDVVVDEENRIVSTPAFMCTQRISEVWTGVSRAVEKMLPMLDR